MKARKKTSSKKPPHRGRIQAQGDSTEKSVKWEQSIPPSRSEMLRKLSELKTKLTHEEMRDREQAFEQLHRFIETAAAAGGISGLFKKSFPYPYQEIRVDLEVLKGAACVPDEKERIEQ